MKNSAKAIMLSLSLVSGALPAAAFPFQHKATTQTTQTVKPHKNFAQRHPIITAVGAAVVIHHFTKKH